jgi:hypothetical protein
MIRLGGYLTEHGYGSMALLEELGPVISCRDLCYELTADRDSLSDSDLRLDAWMKRPICQGVKFMTGMASRSAVYMEDRSSTRLSANVDVVV